MTFRRSREDIIMQPTIHFCLLFLLFLQGLQAIQQFSKEPAYTEVNPGANAKLDCSVNNIGGECRWQKDGKPIGLYPGKYQWSGQQSLGDCGLEVLEVNITFDDGLWECQVTSSDFQSQDALASKPARLVVREPPKSISMLQQNNNSPIAQGGQITVVDGQLESVTCESRQSNPAPTLRWYLADVELKPSAAQTNLTEEGDSRRWKSVSTLQHKFAKEDIAKMLICKVEHPAYPTGFQEANVVLDVMYKPRVRITRKSDDALEEGRSAVTLNCLSDANPPGKAFWRKYESGGEEQRQYVEALEFNPVMRKDSGTYVCQAENSVGISNEEPVQIDVMFPPKILRVSPASGATVGVHNRTVLTCSAEGNPQPKYQWLQKLPSQQVLKRGFEERMVIEDTSYDHQGDYVCEAVNVIAGQRKIVQSEPVHIEVKGAPQVLRYSVAKEIEAISGRDVRLEMEVCSDPHPSRTTWDWGAFRVEAGSELQGRFISEQLVVHPEREDCYFARLHIKQVSPADSKKYFLDVENKHGTDRYAVTLVVKDPVSMASVIGVVIALLAIFVLLVVVLLYAYKKQKMCFKDGSKLDKGIVESPDRHVEFDPEKSVNGRSGFSSAPLPPDGMYHVSDMTSSSLDHLHGSSLADKLWPENPPFQVYIPGYQQHHPSYSQQQQRARSTTPTDLAPLPKDNRMLYAELQFPVTSNFGSMKKRSNRHSSSTTHTNSTAILSLAGDPSPSSSSNTDDISQSMDNVHRYVPDFMAVSNRKTAV